MQINILEAKNNLSSLVVAAERDEEVIIARNGVPVAKIVKYASPKVAPPGVWGNRVAYASDWDSAETNAQAAALFTGHEDASAA
jgi:prevent-host-death family protein